jgi:hypothetical protein
MIDVYYVDFTTQFADSVVSEEKTQIEELDDPKPPTMENIDDMMQKAMDELKHQFGKSI